MEGGNVRGKESRVWQQSKPEVRYGLERQRGCPGAKGKVILRRRWRLHGREKFGGVWRAVKNDFP